MYKFLVHFFLKLLPITFATMIYIGRNITVLRKVCDMSQEELAVKMEMSGRAAISNYENETSFPSLDRVEQLRHIFNISAEILLYFDLSTLSLDQVRILLEGHPPFQPDNKKKKGAK